MNKLSFMIIFSLLILGCIGWAKNLIKLTSCDFMPPYKCEVVHALGVVPPVGIVTGWLNMGK